jgi:hypothetical protein
LTPFQRQVALRRLADGESQADVAWAYDVDPAAICRLARAQQDCGRAGLNAAKSS